ncbi:ABC-2 type transport system permease protein [Paramicrobacterium humi]|uniref:Transport permease protein n=1 Tax=Paramicrobacterium humi TaxID=640635 RepID=A0A1H4IRH4_9MICO|nr:ABC transporter permease [Microbacterium humi]SEB36660.1 ABC-2 type transport system permease protein [Microbacterium humi]
MTEEVGQLEPSARPGSLPASNLQWVSLQVSGAIIRVGQRAAPKQTKLADVLTTADLSEFRTPGRGHGVLDIFTRRYLLKVLVKKDVSTRYRNSVFGWLWSYVKPAAQFAVYYVVMGFIFNLHRGIDNFPVYLFAGIVVVNLFNESFSNATTSIVNNKALVKKIYLPRELFPVATVIVAFVHFLPQVAILLAVCLLTGWVPSFLGIVAILGGMLLILLFSTGLGLFFGALNVAFRDAQNFVEIIRTFATWTAPVLYSWTMLADKAPAWLFHIYMCNPLTAGVELFHFGFWLPTSNGELQTPPHLAVYVAAAYLAAIFVILIGQYVFRRFERNFAQDL